METVAIIIVLAFCLLAWWYMNNDGLHCCLWLLRPPSSV